MKSKNCQFNPKKRRGLSSVVGALLFVVLMVATFSVLGIALNTQTDIVSTARDVASIDLKKQQEEFGISVSTNATQFLSIDVNNIGQNPVEIFTVVMTNVTDIGFPTTLVEIPSDTSFIPSGDDDDIVSTLDLQMNLAPAAGLTETYNFKIISSLGTIKTAILECSFTECGAVVIGGDLIVQLFADGPTGVNTKISTIIMLVTNTADFTYTDVVPMRGFADVGTTCNDPDPITGDLFWEVLIAGPPVFGNDIDPCNFDSIAPTDIGPNGLVIFKWDGTMTGDIGTEFEFCNRVQGDDNLGDPKFSNESCDTLLMIDPNDCGGCGAGGDPIIVLDDLLVRPELFMIIPGPFGLDVGTDPGQGIWGVNVVNPTERSMDIGKVTMVSYPPGANAKHLVFDPTTCDIDDIEPIGDWSCAGENTLMWENILNPITIGPYSSQSFLVKVDPGKIAGGVDLDALIVQANAFTTTGSFGKSGYQTTMYDSPESMVNVFLTDADLGIPEDPTENSHIFSQRLGIQDLLVEEFKITLADMDEDNDTFIKKDSLLVINVPRLWTDVIIVDDTNFVGCTTCPPADDNRIKEFADSSTQILLHTDVDIGGNLNGNNLQDHLTVTFTAIPPDNNGQEFRPYIMYVLAYGETGLCVPDNPNPCIPKPRPIGPLAEIYLQVKD